MHSCRPLLAGFVCVSTDGVGCGMGSVAGESGKRPRMPWPLLPRSVLNTKRLSERCCVKKRSGRKRSGRLRGNDERLRKLVGSLAMLLP